jgi:hypothetical protein
VILFGLVPGWVVLRSWAREVDLMMQRSESVPWRLLLVAGLIVVLAVVLVVVGAASGRATLIGLGAALVSGTGLVLAWRSRTAS